MKRSGGRATPPPDSTTTRTTNRGGGLGTNERVLHVARGGGRGRRGGAVVRVATPRRAARAECAAPGRGSGGVPRLHAGVGLRADRDHGVFGLRVSVLRVVCDGADARHPRAADRHREAAVALSRLSDRKSTRLNSSHGYISYAVFCLKKKKTHNLHLR